MVEGDICPCRDLDTRQHLCLTSAVRGRAGVPPQDRADGCMVEVSTVLTLNVLLLNCRKLFVGGLDWSTTQGRWRGRLRARTADRLMTLVFKSCECASLLLQGFACFL